MATEKSKPKPDPAWVAALEFELEGYRRYGWTERAKDVEAELRASGATVPPPKK